MSKIVGITFTYNEELLVPFVMDYWQKLDVDKLIVYDNCSNDSTVSLLKQYPFVEVRKYDTGGVFDEIILTNLRNACWKIEDADWILLCDFDEVPYYEGDFRAYLESNPASIIQTHQINIVRKDLPEHNGLLHLLPDNEFNDGGIRYDKCHTFNKNKIADMRWAVGCHSCFPIGEVNVERYPQNFYFLHLKYLGEDYTTHKAAVFYERLPQRDKQGRGLNYHIKIIRDEYKNTIDNIIKPRYENLKECIDKIRR